MEHDILISLGSNHNANTNMQHAHEALRNCFANASFSRVLSTAPIGIVGPNFLNCLCRIHSSLSLSDVIAMTKLMENSLGDSKEERKKGHINIDIDILRYDDQKLHPLDWQRPYIPKLMKDIENMVDRKNKKG